jgi:hypothetical protein
MEAAVHGMNDMSEMMWGMGVFHVFGLVVALLVVAALIKYVFFR